MSRWLAAVLFLAPLYAGAQAQDLKLSGYYKSLLIGSKTVLPAGERYSLDLNRLRLEVKGPLSDKVALDFQYDNEMLLGDYLRTRQFALQRDRRPDQYWDLEQNYGEGGSWLGRHRLYRGNVTVAAGDTDVRIGRQRIAWGTGRFWSPLDILNPINPVQIEREERVGVDAVLVERKLGALSRLSGVFAPRRDGSDSAALQWHGNRAGIDFSLIGGRFLGERVFGIDVATQAGDAGLRGELTHTRRSDGTSYKRGVIGVDYAFPNTLTLTAELYYNGAGALDTGAYDFASLFAGRILNVARRYFGGYAAYEITPLLKWMNFLVVNLDDRSRYFSPVLVYSVRENIDLSLGLQRFSGDPGSEYGSFSRVHYASATFFF